MDHADAHANTHAESHVDWGTYKWVALVLLVMTIVEVWAYYIPALAGSRWFVPLILVLGVLKFAIVVMFYMHLKYDSKLFRALFVGPLTIAILILLALMFLFGKVAIHAG